MATMQLTQIYLERDQKKALQARAKANGTKVAEEVRRAVDAYLAGIGPADLQLLDSGTRKAAHQLAEMADELDRINARLDAAFARLSHRRRTRSTGLDIETLRETRPSAGPDSSRGETSPHAQPRRKRATS